MTLFITRTERKRISREYLEKRQRQKLVTESLLLAKITPAPRRCDDDDDEEEEEKKEKKEEEDEKDEKDEEEEEENDDDDDDPGTPITNE